MTGWLAPLLIVGAATGLMVLGIPIAAAMGLVGFFGLAAVASTKVALGAIDLALVSAGSNFTLISVPMFIFMAEILVFSDVSRRLFDAAAKLLGGLPGTLLLGSRLATTLFSAVTGSSVASSATIGSVAIPEMISRGYDRRLSVGSVAAGGALAIVMPPSIVLIIYGFVAEVSVAKLFIAGVIPALLIAAGYLAWNIIIAIRRPDLAPRLATVPAAERLRALKGIWPVILLATLVLGTIYVGVATVTEAAAIGVLGSLALAAMARKLTLANLASALLGTARITGFVFMILIGALIFGFLLSYLKVPAHMSELLLGLDVNRWVILTWVIAVFLVLGTFMDVLAILLVAVPVIVEPMRALGFDPIWLGIVLTIVMEMGLTTPPFGMNLFVVQGVAAYTGYPISYSDAVAGSAPYLIADAAALLLVVLFPALALWLPSLIQN